MKNYEIHPFCFPCYPCFIICMIFYAEMKSTFIKKRLNSDFDVEDSND